MKVFLVSRNVSNPKKCIRLDVGMHTDSKTLTVQNLDVYVTTAHFMETNKYILISFRPQRCCYEAFAALCLPADSTGCIFVLKSHTGFWHIICSDYNSEDAKVDVIIVISEADFKKTES